MEKKEVPPPPRSFQIFSKIRKPPPSFSHSKLPPLPTENPRCPLSHPTHPHTLSLRSDTTNTSFDCFSCKFKNDEYHFFCKTCDVAIHRDCHRSPRKLTHPYHLQHPLTRTYRNYETGFLSDISDPQKLGPVVESDQCTWCGKNIRRGEFFYSCSICNFCLDRSCSENVPLLLIANPKSHHHQLVFYPRPLLTPCDACGLVNVLEPSYVCFQCNYMVHQSCIDLPRVIKITRHQHRLFHTPYLHSTISPCRICYQPVDIKYGHYSCNRDNCSYVVHSKCATHENVGDRKELEWEPEESEKIEDILPFKKVGNDLIKHFSHDHLLKVQRYDGVKDAEKQCHACVLPITTLDFYNCMHCDFFLHEVCAGLLRKLDHALHKHPLILSPTTRNNCVFVDCSSCSRKSTGFRYICPKGDCRYDQAANIDVPCILVPDYFTHQSHDDHPLFICTSSKSETKICCEGCKKICWGSYLQCTKCKFAMCYTCATIPTQISYKYDKHPLSLCYGEEANDIYWCEICEKEINPTEWFYTCNKCCITIHLHCIFGSSVYMKPGFRFFFGFAKVEVLRNSNSTRPLCTECGNRCPGYIYYKIDKDPVEVACSLNCLRKIDRR